MVQLMDFILVGGVLLGAIWAVIKYFVGLGKAPVNEAVSCSGCSTCSTDLSQNVDYGLLRKFK